MIGCASYNLCELRMCQICLVSSVPYLCIEVHMQHLLCFLPVGLPVGRVFASQA